MKIETPCKLCGGKLELEIPAELNEAPIFRDVLLEKIAPMVAHNKCADDFWKSQQRMAIDESTRKRACTWGGICPPEFQNTVWEDIPSPAKDKVLEWQADRGLFLTGESRVGKTRAMYWVLKPHHMAGKLIVSMTHTAFAREAVRLLALDLHREASRWIKILSTCDILFIDDLGKSRFSDPRGNAKYAEELMFDLLDNRMAHQRVCCFTSNDTGESLKRVLSPDKAEPFVARLREHCMAIAM